MERKVLDSYGNKGKGKTPQTERRGGLATPLGKQVPKAQWNGLVKGSNQVTAFYFFDIFTRITPAINTPAIISALKAKVK